MSDTFRAIDENAEELLDQWNLAEDDSLDSLSTSNESRLHIRFKSSTETTSIAPAASPDVQGSAVVEDFTVRSIVAGEVDAPRMRSQLKNGAAVTCLFDPDAEGRCADRLNVQGAAVRSTLPGAGDVIGGFQLVIELGRGAFARVFLAEEVKLGRRLVALKISRAEGEEPQILARLQHAHIVPVHSLHDDPATGLRLLCMPFLGGANLAQVLEESNGLARERATGNGFVEALDQLSQKLPGKAAESLSMSGKSIDRTPWRSRGGSARRSLRRDFPAEAGESTPVDRGAGSAARRPSPGFIRLKRVLNRLMNPATPQPTPDYGIEERLPSRRFLRGADSVRASVWIVAGLAEGLEHAHARGLLHRDLKPSNVLIAADGTPMLLDFNLAVDSAPLREQGTEGETEFDRAKLGGTLPYMAPEHLDAFDPKGSTRVDAVDERSDLYSLGLILFEMVAGESAFDPPPSQGISLQTLRRMVRERRKTPPPSLRSRRPDVPPSLDALVAQCLDPDPDRRHATAGALAEDLRRFLDDLPMKHCPEPSLVERAGKWTRRHPVLCGSTSIVAAAVVLVVLLGLAAAQAYEGMQGLQSRLSFRVFQRDALESRFYLNTLSQDDVLIRKGVALAEASLRKTWASGSNAAEAEEHGSSDHRPAPWISRLSSGEREEVRRSSIELVLQIEHARVVMADRAGDQQERRSALQGAVARLDQIESANPHPPSILFRQRAWYHAALGEETAAQRDRNRADAQPPATSHDWTMLGAFSFANGDRIGAEQALRKAVALDVTSFWGWFYLGHCHFEQGRFAEAVSDFTACAVARPEFAWVHFNRGLALVRAGRPREARDAFDSALALDGDFAEVLVDRGLVALELNDPIAAETDLRRGMDLGRRDPAVLAALGDAMTRQGKTLEAERMFDEWIARNPGDATLRVARGITRLGTDPESAAADFHAVLALNSHHPLAHFGLACVLREGDRPSALAHLDQAIKSDSDLIDAYELRALIRAREGDRAALDDVDRLVKSPTPHRLYNAACALSILGRKIDDDRFHGRAVEILEASLRTGFPAASAVADPDLAPLRDRDDYRALIARQSAAAAR